MSTMYCQDSPSDDEGGNWVSKVAAFMGVPRGRGGRGGGRPPRWTPRRKEMYSQDSSSDDECDKWMGRASKVTAVLSKMKQSRFQRIPDEHLNRATVAGIRDMDLGRVKNGKHVGAPTIQFNSGVNTGYTHIKVGPKGAENSHIKVPNGVIKGAEVANKVLKYTGITLSVAGNVLKVWQIASAYIDDVHTLINADAIISELEDAIEKLKEALKNTSSAQERREIAATIEHLENVLKDVKRCKKFPPIKTIKKVSSVAGAMTVGSVTGPVGAWAGAQTGAAVGSIFGPVGVVVGGPVGAIVGAFGGAYIGSEIGSGAGEAAADQVLKLAD